MNKDILIMIELQKYWNKILEKKGDIERDKKSILSWKKKLKDEDDALTLNKNNLLKLNNSFKENDFTLTEICGKIEKIDERLLLLKSEKELLAQTHELDALKENKDELEETVLGQMEQIEELEEKISILDKELEERKIQVKNDNAGLSEKIKSSEAEVQENKNKFEELSQTLSNLVKSRFLKLIGSKNGKAIGEVVGEICTSCNFAIPSSLVSEAGKSEKVVTCTNCGRFIYVK